METVIPTRVEQEYLLTAIEASLHVRDARSCFLWTQGPLQAVLPHRILVCLQFGADDQLDHVECLHSNVLGRDAMQLLAHPCHGLAVRMARHCRNEATLPVSLEAGAQPAALAMFEPELRAQGLDNVLLHGTEKLAGGATFFALFGMPQRPHARHAYFLELLLPQLHLAMLRIGQGSGAGPSRGEGVRPVSRREMEILHWVREGKSNDEVGQILGISGLTVKNHLQRIYKTLGVRNRTQAVARGTALRLLDATHPHA
jgi:transcriptional regulator EpsA